MAINWLKLNDDKTEFFVLGSNPNLLKIKTHSITVGEHQIRRSNQVRNIGAIFDANAKMEGQVTKTCQTAWFHLYTISKISQYLTKEQKQTIIHAYVTPRLDQNNSLLGGLPLTQMNKLQLVQNSAAKIILGGKKHDHVTDHLIKLHWLPISQRRIFKILLLVFKALNGQGPIYLAEMLVPCSNNEHDLRSSYDNLLVVPATDSVTYGDRAFSVLGPSLWNNLPKKIRCSSSVPSFKSALKTHLFKQSFGV